MCLMTDLLRIWCTYQRRNGSVIQSNIQQRKIIRVSFVHIYARMDRSSNQTFNSANTYVYNQIPRSRSAFCSSYPFKIKKKLDLQGVITHLSLLPDPSNSITLVSQEVIWQQHLATTYGNVWIHRFTIMILPQVHLRKPCYDFYFL